MIKHDDMMLKVCLGSAAATALILSVSGWTTSFDSLISWPVSAGTAVGLLYERFLWKWNPLEKTPRIGGAYNCRIVYAHHRGSGEKRCKAIIKQTLRSVSITLKTDEVLSRSTSASIINNDVYILQYIYTTEPSAIYRNYNPTQDGAAKLRIAESGLLRVGKRLEGSYWTSSETKGDIILTRIKQ